MEALTDFRRAVSEVAVAAREDSYTKHTGHNRAIPGPAFAVQGEATETEWAAACAAICDTLAAFPTGCTRAVLISEVAAHLRSDHLRVAGSLSKVVAASRIGKVDEVVDVQVHDVRSMQHDHASAVVLTLADTVPPSDAPHERVDAYLHTRFEHLLGSPLLPDPSTTPGARRPRLRIAGFTTVRHPTGGLRLLPTEFATFILEPGVPGESHPPALQFILEKFSDDSMSTSVIPGADLLLLTRVLEVGVAERVRHPDHCDRLVISLGDFDGTAPSRRGFVLYDDQIALGQLLQRGDVVAVARPHVPDHTDENGRYHLEYGGDCTLFLLPHALITDDARDQLSQALSPEKADSSNSFRGGSPRDCIVGTVVAVSGNVPDIDEDRVQDRLLVRVDDGAAEVTIVLFGRTRIGTQTNLGGCALMVNGARIRTGQIVVLDGLSSAGEESASLGADLVADYQYGAMVHCPSALGAGIHLIPRSVELLQTFVEDRSCRFVVNAAVTSVDPMVEGGCCVTEVHVDCQWPVFRNLGRWDCVFCRLQGVEVERAYHIQLTLDDGSFSAQVEACGSVIAALLPLSASDFSSLPISQQTEVLSALLCRDVVVDVCSFEAEDGRHQFRADAIVFANPSRFCRDHPRTN